jgi:DNA-binding FadR family transcriptional regulator
MVKTTVPTIHSKAVHADLGYRRPPGRKSMHPQIVRDLGISILRGELRPGDRLPSEAMLCEAYEVSRPVLREATRVLAAKGLIISRQKAGASVRPARDWHLLDPDVLYWMIQSKPPREFVQTLMTVRRIFEPAAASLAATCASDDMLEAITEAYGEMEAAKTPEELLEPDLAFHRLIAEATGNELMAYIGNMLSLALRESIKLSSRLANTRELSLPRHKAILRALMKHDGPAAHRAALAHLEETAEDLSRILET